MTKVYEVKSLKDLPGPLAKHQKDREKRILRGVRRAARSSSQSDASVVKRNIPVAFGELRESVHVEDTGDGANVVVDAPHAAPVETGSRPHMPPLEPLIAWVKLRGMQALSTPRQRARLPGTTTNAAATEIGKRLESTVSGGASPVDAPVQVARAIQQAIAKRGTRPHWFMRGSLRGIEAVLDRCVREELAKEP